MSTLEIWLALKVYLKEIILTVENVLQSSWLLSLIIVIAEKK